MAIFKIKNQNLTDYKFSISPIKKSLGTVRGVKSEHVFNLVLAKDAIAAVMLLS